MAALRLLDKSRALLSLSELGFLHESLERYEKMLKVPYGIILVSGPTGAGKTTTLYASINCLDQVGRNIITIEDPIEYVHPNHKSVITQRELGSDTMSFAEALKHVLRQDPDVILVGEMRDLETAAAALTVAETGHLVLTTGHAPSASQAIERITDLFPPQERHLAQTQLASLLVGVLCQTLIPRADGSGRVAAVEIMLANSAVRSLIRDGKTHQLPNTIRMNGQQGMQLLDRALVNLYQEGAISQESLFSFCNERDEVGKLIGHTEDLQPSTPTLINNLT
ncbi:Twitching mobility protein [subsurface metagenome]